MRADWWAIKCCGPVHSTSSLCLQGSRRSQHVDRAVGMHKAHDNGVLPSSSISCMHHTTAGKLWLKAKR